MRQDSSTAVTIGIESIERTRQSSCFALRQALRQVLRDARAVGADDDPKSTLRRAPASLEQLRALLAAGSIALLCACADPQICHRTVVTARLAAEGFPIVQVRREALDA